MSREEQAVRFAEKHGVWVVGVDDEKIVYADFVGGNIYHETHYADGRVERVKQPKAPNPRRIKELVGTITGESERRRNSAYGNPRWWVLIDGKRVSTVADAQVGYAVTNFHVGDRVVCQMRAGEIVRMKLAN